MTQNGAPGGVSKSEEWSANMPEHLLNPSSSMTIADNVADKWKGANGEDIKKENGNEKYIDK